MTKFNPSSIDINDLVPKIKENVYVSNNINTINYFDETTKLLGKYYDNSYQNSNKNNDFNYNAIENSKITNENSHKNVKNISNGRAGNSVDFKRNNIIEDNEFKEKSEMNIITNKKDHQSQNNNNNHNNHNNEDVNVVVIEDYNAKDVNNIFILV